MRTLIVHAHPSPESFSAALAREAQAALVEAGHVTEFCDLYAEKFDPVLPITTFRHYLDPAANLAGVESYAESLRKAEAVVFAFPVWHDGPPAILKGYFDRVFVRGVAFEIVEGVFYPHLQNIRRLGAIALYGAERARTRRVGDLPRRFVKHNLMTLLAPDARLDYFGFYGMDHGDPQARAAFLAKIRRSFRTW